MRSITLACLLALGCAHAPAGPAGDRIRGLRAAAVMFAVGGATLSAGGGALFGLSPPAHGIGPSEGQLAGGCMLGVGIIQLITAASLAGATVEKNETEP